MNVVSYTELIKVLLGESAKYILLFLFVVLSIRLWRRLKTCPAPDKTKGALFAAVVSVLACGMGLASMLHSMSLLYSHYGNDAFMESKFSQAASLFESSSQFWKTADAAGKKGVCLLFSSRPEEAKGAFAEAKRLRHGQESAFEQFYQGLYHFLHKQPDAAIPFLKPCLADPEFYWRAAKTLAVIDIEKNQIAEAQALMKPFQGIEVTEPDFAFVTSALLISDGKKAEAKLILDKFLPETLSPLWKSRFESLRVQVQH